MKRRVGIQIAQRMQAGNEIGGTAEAVERGLAHAGHDAHVRGDVGAVRDLDANFAVGRFRRTQDIRHHVHRAALHRAVEKRADLFLRLGRSHPVVGGAGVLFLSRADEG